MKNLYLVEFELTEKHYMADQSTRFNCTRIVWAENKEEAEQIIENHYESKTSEYAVYRDVYIISVTEALGNM